MDALLAVYPWIKACHVISVIAWMAGMLYLPRLFVYHCDAAPGTPASETFKVMERRLLRAIINPAMIATFLLDLGQARPRAGARRRTRSVGALPARFRGRPQPALGAVLSNH